MRTLQGTKWRTPEVINIVSSKGELTTCLQPPDKRAFLPDPDGVAWQTFADVPLAHFSGLWASGW